MAQRRGWRRRASAPRPPMSRPSRVDREAGSERATNWSAWLGVCLCPQFWFFLAASASRPARLGCLLYWVGLSHPCVARAGLPTGVCLPFCCRALTPIPRATWMDGPTWFPAAPLRASLILCTVCASFGWLRLRLRLAAAFAPVSVPDKRDRAGFLASREPSLVE